jgi:hypothetical protein
MTNHDDRLLRTCCYQRARPFWLISKLIRLLDAAPSGLVMTRAQIEYYSALEVELWSLPDGWETQALIDKGASA